MWISLVSERDFYAASHPKSVCMKECRIEVGTKTSSPLLTVKEDGIEEMLDLNARMVDAKPNSVEFDLVNRADPPDGCKYGGNQGEGNRDDRLKCRPDRERGSEDECEEREGDSERGVDSFAKLHAGTVGERRVTLNCGLHPTSFFRSDAFSTREGAAPGREDPVSLRTLFRLWRPPSFRPSLC